MSYRNAGREYASADQLLHAMTMQAIGVAWQVLDQHRAAYEKLIQANRDLDNFGHIVDPTLWIKARHGETGRNVEAQVKLAETTLRFLREVDAIKATLPQGSEVT